MWLARSVAEWGAFFGQAEGGDKGLFPHDKIAFARLELPSFSFVKRGEVGFGQALRDLFRGVISGRRAIDKMDKIFQHSHILRFNR